MLTSADNKLQKNQLIPTNLLILNVFLDFAVQKHYSYAIQIYNTQMKTCSMFMYATISTTVLCKIISYTLA